MGIHYALPWPRLWVVVKILSMFGVSLPLLAPEIGVPGCPWGVSGRSVPSSLSPSPPCLHCCAQPQHHSLFPHEGKAPGSRQDRDPERCGSSPVPPARSRGMDVEWLNSVDPRSSVLLFPWQLGLSQALPPTANPCQGEESRVSFLNHCLAPAPLCAGCALGCLSTGELCTGWVSAALGAGCAEGAGPGAESVPGAKQNV